MCLKRSHTAVPCIFVDTVMCVLFFVGSFFGRQSGLARKNVGAILTRDVRSSVVLLWFRRVFLCVGRASESVPTSTHRIFPIMVY